MNSPVSQRVSREKILLSFAVYLDCHQNILSTFKVSLHIPNNSLKTFLHRCAQCLPFSWFLIPWSWQPRTSIRVCMSVSFLLDILVWIFKLHNINNMSLNITSCVSLAIYLSFNFMILFSKMNNWWVKRYDYFTACLSISSIIFQRLYQLIFIQSVYGNNFDFVPFKEKNH